MSLVECPETKHTTPDAIVFTKASNMNWKKSLYNKWCWRKSEIRFISLLHKNPVKLNQRY